MAPLPSFLKLPAEPRLQVCSHLLPDKNYPSAYAGLRQTHRQMREEYDHEALAAVLNAWEGIHTVRPRTLADVNTGTVRLRLRTGLPCGPHKLFTQTMPFNLFLNKWPWMRRLKITYDQDTYDQDKERPSAYWLHTHWIRGWILLRNAEIKGAKEASMYSLLSRSELEEVVIHWTNLPDRYLLPCPFPNAWVNRLTQLSSHYTWRFDRLWHVTAQYDAIGTPESMTWKRKTNKDAKHGLAAIVVLCFAFLFVLAYIFHNFSMFVCKFWSQDSTGSLCY